MVELNLPFGLSLMHNVLQIVTWLFVFISMLPAERSALSFSTWLDICNWKMDHYWDDSLGFKKWLVIAQSL